jgi:hypothetical protein
LESGELGSSEGIAASAGMTTAPGGIEGPFFVLLLGSTGSTEGEPSVFGLIMKAMGGSSIAQKARNRKYLSLPASASLANSLNPTHSFFFR